MTEGQCNLSSIEPSSILRESFEINDLFEQLPTFNKVHQEIYPDVILEHILHAHNEWMRTLIVIRLTVERMCFSSFADSSCS